MAVAVKEAVAAPASEAWAGLQATAGTPLAHGSSALFKLPAVTSELIPYKETGEQDYMDGLVFANAQTFTKQVGGAIGGFSCLAYPDVLGRLAAIFFAEDTVTGSGDPYTHTITSGGDTETWMTIFQRLGSSGGQNLLQRFGDCKMQSFKFEAGDGQDGGALITVGDIMGINAGDYKSTAPSATVASDTKAIEWANVEGTIEVNGTAIATVTGESLEVSREYELGKGDSPYIKALVGKKGLISRSLTAFLSEETLPVLKNALYGTTTPSDNDEITTNVVEISVETIYTADTNRSVTITTPKVLVAVQDMVSDLKGDVEGGLIPLTIGGRCVPTNSADALTIAVTSSVSSAFI